MQTTSEMAAEQWAGFTDEDIEKMKTPVLTNDISMNKILKPLERASYSKDAGTENIFLTPNSKNLDSLENVQHFVGTTWKINGKDTQYSSNEILNNCTCESYSTDLSDESCEAISNCDNKLPNERSLDTTGDITELEMFEARQKRVEAENARRRALINKAIQDKKKRTQAEASKLSQITAELNCLDSMLSNDVSILRNYIEKASMEFSQAEKRYLKAEKELIDAKLELYEKMQRKEQLTEHLCAIIEQNENRKAARLVELMKQLEMETIIEDLVSPDMQPILSKYCVMNDEAYHCCQTIKPLPLNSKVQNGEKNEHEESSERKSSQNSNDNYS